MSKRAELVELVIGVDTHADTHTAAVLATDTRAVLAPSPSPSTRTPVRRTSCWGGNGRWSGSVGRSFTG
jgi:hypothetical protein